ncbi:unnamed protein product [Adineta steineri]|uniref:Microbial-type PARG catalytic domain-containing protein n=1 Tax=Adineta steineri TaxID=433720 RepID=A0A815GFF1_9BILA|nr:unnamed protein product [Adineta steineri]CAF3981921.1 unnamed protein product [Adineta steineri]
MGVDGLRALTRGTDGTIVGPSLVRSVLSQKIYVYITDLPPLNKSDSELASLIGQRIEKTFRLTLGDIQCYSRLGVGRVRVQNDDTKHFLTETVGTLALNPQDASATIRFTETFKYVSYIVLTALKVDDDMEWPKPEKIIRRWNEMYSGEGLQLCEQVDIQFQNVYRIFLSLFDELGEIMRNPDFGIDDNSFARIYLGADCSYLENLPKSISDDQIREAIGTSIGQIDPISKPDLYIQLNKQTNNVCLIASNMARKLTTKSIYLGQQPIMTTESLSLCLLIHFDPRTCDEDTIIRHSLFNGKARLKKRRGDSLIVEITDKTVLNECIKRKVVCIGDQVLPLKLYTPSIDPEECEIDADTWYKEDMLRYKADIMKFIPDHQHKIFRLKWNAKNWLDEFRRVKDKNQNTKNNDDSKQSENITFSEMRHRLRVTVMLNTVGAIYKKAYMIGDREIKLNLDPNMKTIIYNHESKLASGGPMPLKKTPYDKTKVSVVNKDCVLVYEDLVKQQKKPLLLNMANTSSPGGSYRKGDGAQEENLFRRSDYIRSLDVDLDQYVDDSSERSACTSTCDLDSSFDSRNMYPMDEYGAIYTSGLTFFRGTEDDGYAFMEEPLTGVCSLAMAAYRDPKLDGNILAPKFAVGTRKKIENIFAIAYHHKHDCIILSALGCGAYRNPPEHIAKIFRSVIEQYAGFFELIVFAIIDDHNTGQTLNKQGNYQPFYEELNDQTMKPHPLTNQANTICGPYRFSSDGVTVQDILIYNLEPCNFGAKCNKMYDSQHATDYSHPSACIQQSLHGSCTKTDDVVHMSSFIHSEPCKHGAQCSEIDNKEHARRFEHPSFCPNGGACQDTTDTHEKAYRHLALCKHGHRCLDFKKGSQPHCNSFRHYMPGCEHGQYCVSFHNKEHMSNYKHSFPTPCPWTPYNCGCHNVLTQTPNTGKVSQVAHQHCVDYAHVCPFGRYCTDPNSWHWEKWIHIARMPCKSGNGCNRLNDEDHLNSFTHPKIRDIRIGCKNADKCQERQDPNHLSKYRHSMTFKDSGVVGYFNLNKNLNFVENQNNNIQRLLEYAKKKDWKKFNLKSIPTEFIDWLQTVQPVHRCKLEIFESIILHGHVMSLEYMDNLSKPKFVANSILQHSQIRRIERLKIQECAGNAREYITALVSDIYEKAGFLKRYVGDVTESLTTHVDDTARLADRADWIKKKERALSAQLKNQEDMETIREKTKEIAEASIKLNSNKSGIGYAVDKKLGTDKTIFSILGPHTGQYYGDVVLVFKREILHHPDANFTLQAGTSYYSGNCYDWRPWFGTAPKPKVESTQIDLFHKTKLHPSVPGYEYAAALELIAITSHKTKKKPAEIDLDQAIQRWLTVDSHEVIEAHLPPLIPLDYIEQIYMPQSIYKALSENTRKIVDDLFKGCLTVSDKDSKDYNKFVLEELDQRFRSNDRHSVSRPTIGSILTIPATNFNDHYVLPLTISQAEEQYHHDSSHITRESTIYIYWQLMNGDMMLTLSAKPIDTDDTNPKNSCLICYVAPKPSFDASCDIEYHEQTSYLNSGQPYEHSVFVNEKRFAGKSNEFYMGCNTDDLMTLCLEIQRAKGIVNLFHAGPNAIYNHQKISWKFSKTELDTKKLEFIHVSAGNGTVPIRNLNITFEKQEYLHPTLDPVFNKDPLHMTRKVSTEATIDTTQMQHPTQDDQNAPSHGIVSRFFNQIKDMLGGNDNSTLKPCPKGINCPIQFSDNTKTHNAQYSHPCRFAELCRKPEIDLTHPQKRRELQHCSSDTNCNKLCDPIHRARFVHTGLPFYLIPCRQQQNCRDNTEVHRKKYSHGEEDLEKINKEIFEVVTSPSTQHAQKSQKNITAHATRIPCKWGLACRNAADPEHCEKYSHPPGTLKSDNRIPCRYGAQCHDHKPDHKKKYSHPSA